jgi:hypothetical protein
MLRFYWLLLCGDDQWKGPHVQQSHILVGVLGEGGMNHACLDGFHPLTSVLPGVGWMGIKVARGCEKLPRNRDGL